MFEFVPVGEDPQFTYGNTFYVINKKTKKTLGLVFQNLTDKKWYIYKQDSSALEDGYFNNQEEVVAFLQNRR